MHAKLDVAERLALLGSSLAHLAALSLVSVEPGRLTLIKRPAQSDLSGNGNLRRLSKRGDDRLTQIIGLWGYTLFHRREAIIIIVPMAHAVQTALAHHEPVDRSGRC